MRFIYSLLALSIIGLLGCAGDPLGPNSCDNHIHAYSCPDSDVRSNASSHEYNCPDP